ncbi:unnamed protein product [Lampetra fluviatilis]
MTPWWHSMPSRRLKGSRCQKHSPKWRPSTSRRPTFDTSLPRGGEGEAETPLAFRSTLLSLVQAAFPKMARAGLDSLVLKRMLALAQEPGVVLPATEDDDLTSFKIARSIQAHLHLKRRAGVAACIAPSEVVWVHPKTRRTSRYALPSTTGVGGEATQSDEEGETSGGDLFSPRKRPRHLLQLRPAMTRLEGMPRCTREALQPAVILHPDALNSAGVLSPAEQSYCVTCRELLAIVVFVQQYHPYLYGRSFEVRMDHAALQIETPDIFDVASCADSGRISGCEASIARPFSAHRYKSSGGAAPVRASSSFPGALKGAQAHLTWRPGDKDSFNDCPV